MIVNNSVYGCCINNIIDTITYDGGWHKGIKRQMLKELKDLDDAVYCDTDSIKTVHVESEVE